MTGTSNTNNTGVMHLVRKFGDAPVCKKRRAIMATTPDKFTIDSKPCKRCAAIFAKWQARAAVSKVEAA